MGSISLLTVVRKHIPLDNLLRGVAAQTKRPEEVVLVYPDGVPTAEPTDPGCKMYRYAVPTNGQPFSQAAARNHAAGKANGEVLAFLDVDCIPHPKYLEKLEAAVSTTHALVVADVRYLPEGAAAGNWTNTELERASVAHPRRPRFSNEQELMGTAYSLFRSLAFGIRATDFERLGGFDRRYTGHCGEDTDFALRAHRSRLPIFTCPGRAYHQYHPGYVPPLDHLEDIVRNARLFHRKWGNWPVQDWLSEFKKAGYIDWKNDRIEVIARPDAAALEAARNRELFG